MSGRKMRPLVWLGESGLCDWRVRWNIASDRWGLDLVNTVAVLTEEVILPLSQHIATTLPVKLYEQADRPSEPTSHVRL